MDSKENLADKIVYNGEYFFVSKDIIPDRKTPIYYILQQSQYFGQ